MSNKYIRLASAPALNHPGNPYCDACNSETLRDDGAWICETCGTAWFTDDMEASSDEAMLYPVWSGEELTGPVCQNDEAWHVAHLTPYRRDAWLRKHSKDAQ